MRARSSWTRRRLLLNQLADEESLMELANTLPVVAMARLAGVAAPDKSSVSFTREGYVRIAWTETKESVEE